MTNRRSEKLEPFLSTYLSQDKVERVLNALTETGQPLDVVITELGMMHEQKLAQAFSDFLAIPFQDDILPLVDDGSVSKFGAEFFLQSHIIPVLGSGDDSNFICVADPLDAELLNLLRYSLDSEVKFCVSTRAAITTAINSITSVEQHSSLSELNNNAGVSDEDLARLKSIAEEAPIVRLVTSVLNTAVDEGATDVHFEPMSTTLAIRMRIDGVLSQVKQVPKDMLAGISTRIKILSQLNISERRLPQDGRMRSTIRGVDVDFRVSIVPSIHGETIVLRVLDRSQIRLDLPALGFDDKAQQSLRSLAKLSNGIVLVTGPTGSGKTTTLYAMLGLANNGKLKIFTIEDPVEYPMDGVTQLQVNAPIGLTFSKSLRSVLRQDPDIILVGEIRDSETAELAMQAALTGHLVLATLHTNSAISAVTRLRDLGADDYLIGATLKGCLAQRLVRRLCQGCSDKKSARIDCKNCGGTGYRGRIVVYELIAVDDELSAQIADGGSENTLVATATNAGMVPLSTHAAQLERKGVTSKEELQRVLNSGES